MALKIIKSQGRYIAEGELHGKVFQTEDPKSARSLIDWLQECGFHQTDIGDAMHDADPQWVDSLKHDR